VVLDLEAAEGFLYSSEWGADKTVHTELSIADYLATRQDRKLGPDVERAKKDRVLVRTEGEVDRPLASVYRCIIAEVTHQARTFQLVDGHWYVIEPDFEERIRDQVRALPGPPMAFPPLHAGETEQAYNQRVATSLTGLLMDRNTVPIGGGANRIEVCDIAFTDRTLVHAKKRSASSTLSHLWSQGTVALDALLGDAAFRIRVRDRIHSLDPSFDHLVNDGLVGADYTVVYLLLGVDQGTQPWQALPFFSQVALSQAARTLRNMGASVALAGA
jgi:uncharacterized protein (TIGR04141 family)